MSESSTDNKDINQLGKNTEVKESPSRSLVKALSYRILATFATFIISFIVFHNYTEKTYSEIGGISAIIAISEFILKIFFYYIHERFLCFVPDGWGYFFFNIKNIYNFFISGDVQRTVLQDSFYTICCVILKRILSKRRRK